MLSNAPSLVQASVGNRGCGCLNFYKVAYLEQAGENQNRFGALRPRLRDGKINEKSTTINARLRRALALG